MPEFIRSIKVHVEVDSNKQTRVLEFDDDDYAPDEMPSVLHDFLEGLGA